MKKDTKTFILKTMGCKSNQLEGALIEQNLVASGFEKTQKICDADFFILNSCTVTHKSDNEAFRILLHAKKQNPEIKTVLTGCIAQIEKENLLENPNIDIVLGNDEKLEISRYLTASIGLNSKPDVNRKSRVGLLTHQQKADYALNSAKGKISVGKIEEVKEFHKALLTDTKKTRASLKIQDGCDNRCSYCIIPFARGKSRSADLDFILEQIKLYEKAGFKEIILTGIHIGQWQGEEREAKSKRQKAKSDDNTLCLLPFALCKENSSRLTSHVSRNLLSMLQAIEQQTNIPRFRLGSLNPLEIDDEMLDFLKNSEKFCPHFHLSLQSMCDKTLKSMNRHYSVQQALDLIEKIVEIFPLAFIGSDIIVGFAGESEEDFQTTVENLKKSKLTQIHTFPYSIRKGTAAEGFENHLPQKIKQERAEIIKRISAQKYEEFLQKNDGTVQEVLIEKNLDKKTGWLKGVSRNYINVFIEPKGEFESARNILKKVKIKRGGNQILGEIVLS